MTMVNAIILPNQPQFDPLAAAYLLRGYGEPHFPGVSASELRLWEYSKPPTPEELAQWQANGWLAVDLGGGQFDHHGRVPPTTATHLVAQALGIAERPELANLLEYAYDDDTAGLHNRYGDLAYFLKCAYAVGQLDHHRIIELFETCLDTFQRYQGQWHQQAAAECERACRWDRIDYGQRKLKLAIIQSDDAMVANYARKEKGAGLVLQRRSTGHTLLFTQKALRLDLRPAVAAIRQAELQATGAFDPAKHTPVYLAKFGFLPELPLWYFHASLNAMMNGSESLQKTPPTKLPLETFVQILKTTWTLPKPDPLLGQSPSATLPKLPFYKTAF